MKRVMLAAAAFGAAIGTPALAVDPPVQTARGDWSQVPRALTRGRDYVNETTIEQIERVARSGACNVPGLHARRLNLAVPFVIKFSARGTLEQVVVRDLDCAPLERIVGRVVMLLAQQGEYRPTGENQEGWYRGEFVVNVS